jgi:hypothetical protein
MEEQMKKLLGGLGLLTLMAFSVFTGPSQAATATKKITVTPKNAYDVSKEVTLTGTVSDVVKKPKAGMLLGTHLTLATTKGSVDAHIGSYAGRDKHLDSLAAGQSIKAVGMMMTLKQGQVFIVRTIEVNGGETLTVRNKNGFFVGPASPRYTAKANAKGASKITAKGGQQ